MMQFAAEMNRKKEEVDHSPRACVSCIGTSENEYLKKINDILSTDNNFLCELRLDYLKLNSVECLNFLKKIPSHWQSRIILTHRRKTRLSPGHCDWPLELWLTWWKEAEKLGTWFAFDIDWLGENTPYPKLRQKIFFSLHAPISDLCQEQKPILQVAKKYSAGMKFATHVEGGADISRFIKFSEEVKVEQKNYNLPFLVFVAMGDAGRAWRWSSLSGDWSYFSYGENEKTASGQSTWQDFLPYRKQKQWPKLFLLLGRDPKNRFGENKWNELFLKRKWNARYIALAYSDSISNKMTEQKKWTQENLYWMKHAKIQGASITQPYKKYFLTIRDQKDIAINTITKNFKRQSWRASNTDGPAVYKILTTRKLVRDTSLILIIGSGGAAKAITQTFDKNKIKYYLWKRNKENILDYNRIKNKKFTGMISTWPHAYQNKLVGKLKNLNLSKLEFCIDAQLQQKESSLEKLCIQNNIYYISGSEWWKEQAAEQDKIWFGDIREDFLQRKIQKFLPRSKSETIRALAISLALKKNITIWNPAICEDSTYFKEAIKKFGVDIQENDNRWILKVPEVITIPKTPIYLGESATAFRFLGVMSSCFPKGEVLQLDCAESLRIRPMQPLLDGIRLEWDGKWPMRIPCGNSLASKISLNTTSQVASAAMIVATAKVIDGNQEIRLELDGEARSIPYLEMTIRFLEQLRINDEISISPDPSGLAFIEVIQKYFGFRASMERCQRNDGDFIFSNYLSQLRESEDFSISLADYPDLAPPLWAAAILFRKKIHIHSTPHLHAKECDRAKVLSNIAIHLGFKAENLPDGFILDARKESKKIKDKIQTAINEENDHRIAMALGVLKARWPELQVQNPECVKKSFPYFWQCLEVISQWTL